MALSYVLSEENVSLQSLFVHVGFTFRWEGLPSWGYQVVKEGETGCFWGIYSKILGNVQVFSVLWLEWGRASS